MRLKQLNIILSEMETSVVLAGIKCQPQILQVKVLTVLV